MARFAICSVGVLVVLVATQIPALAGQNTAVPTPEIDATSLSTGLSLLAAGVMIARAYRRK